MRQVQSKPQGPRQHQRSQKRVPENPPAAGDAASSDHRPGQQEQPNGEGQRPQTQGLPRQPKRGARAHGTQQVVVGFERFLGTMRPVGSARFDGAGGDEQIVAAASEQTADQRPCQENRNTHPEDAPDAPESRMPPQPLERSPPIGLGSLFLSSLRGALGCSGFRLLGCFSRVRGH